jgi:RNA polymerase sigma factor (sigma-70 family)
MTNADVMEAPQPTTNDRPSGGSAFPMTRWSLIAGARADESAVVHAALAQLCEHYWHPIYAFLRRSGHHQQDAEDLTQSFFASLLGREVFARVNSEGGKLRTYLLASLKNHLANERRAAGRQKRGGGAVAIPIDSEESERRIEKELVDEMTPERAFDRAWVLTLLNKVLASLEREYLDAGKNNIFQALRLQLVERGEGSNHADVAARLGMSEGAVRVAAHRLRSRYREMLVQEVAETVDGVDAVGAELEFLVRTLN